MYFLKITIVILKFKLINYSSIKKIDVYIYVLVFCILFVKHVKQQGQVFISNELNRTDITQTTYVHMTEKESVMMTKLGGFPSIKFFGII